MKGTLLYLSDLPDCMLPLGDPAVVDCLGTLPSGLSAAVGALLLVVLEKAAQYFQSGEVYMIEKVDDLSTVDWRSVGRENELAVDFNEISRLLVR